MKILLIHVRLLQHYDIWSVVFEFRQHNSGLAHQAMRIPRHNLDGMGGPRPSGVLPATGSWAPGRSGPSAMRLGPLKILRLEALVKLLEQSRLECLLPRLESLEKRGNGICGWSRLRPGSGRWGRNWAAWHGDGLAQQPLACPVQHSLCDLRRRHSGCSRCSLPMDRQLVLRAKSM